MVNSVKEAKALKSKHSDDLHILLCGTVEWYMSAAVFSVVLGMPFFLEYDYVNSIYKAIRRQIIRCQTT